jgi:predicted phage terminase large subunit-like protein
MEGFGYDLIILNEAGIILRNEKLWNETIRPMALDFDADLIIGGTPKGKRNKQGTEHLFFTLFKKGERSIVKSERNDQEYEQEQEFKVDHSHSLRTKWKSFCFSSYDNPLIKKEVIDEFVSEVSPQLRDQEIFGKFVDYSNESIIKRDWWRHSRQKDGGQDSDDLNNNKKSLGVYQSWDTAFKVNEENDYSVCTTWKIFDNGFYLIDLLRERLEFPELKRKVVELHEKFLPREILIEDHASGQSLIQELRRETRLPIKPIRKDKDKISYVHAITPLIEAGKVILSGNVKSETADVMINECEEFPNGEHDDIVDSISQFLNYAKNFKSSFEEIVTKKVQRKKFY